MALVYVRHGKTSHNLGGSEEKLRGWLPLPLTEEGRAQADATGKALKGMNRPTTFASSDLPRAMESARIIGKHIGMDPTPTRPFGIGIPGDSQARNLAQSRTSSLT